MLGWDDLRTFLAIARSHTLSGAARALGVRQSTMGRRLDALEARAGVRLLSKTPTGYVLTKAGEAALAHVERMEEEALAVEFAVAGRDERLEGVVRLTTVGTLAVSVLPQLLTQFHARYPAITIEVLTETRALSLSRREADLSLWPERPTGNELIARRIGEIPFGLYASPDYLAQRGPPDFTAGAPGHSVILRNRPGMDAPEMVWMTSLTAAAGVALRTVGTDFQLAAAEAGLGLACLPARLTANHRLSEIQTPSPAPKRGLWIAVHQDTRATPRVRALMDALVTGLRV
ncbi:MAG: LysR family transcriptional regulator [Acetobacteraceae bacterium]|nr:LysR family transcriptional regulator [Acetobacteraceae bacterium]